MIIIQLNLINLNRVNWCILILALGYTNKFPDLYEKMQNHRDETTDETTSQESFMLFPRGRLLLCDGSPKLDHFLCCTCRSQCITAGVVSNFLICKTEIDWLTEMAGPGKDQKNKLSSSDAETINSSSLYQQSTSNSCPFLEGNILKLRVQSLMSRWHHRPRVEILKLEDAFPADWTWRKRCY